MRNESTLDVSRIREVLQAEAAKAAEPVVETVPGLVRVTMDGNLRVQAVELLGDGADAKAREALQRAIADAFNGAVRKIVQSRAEAVTRVQAQLDWRALVGGGPPAP
jgi:DNA-binding protein YbaB